MEEEKKEAVVEEQKAPETAPVPEVKVSEMNEEEVQLEKADAKYDAENIQVLEGLEAVGTKLAVVKPCKNGLAVETFNLSEKEAQAALRAAKKIYENYR